MTKRDFLIKYDSGHVSIVRATSPQEACKKATWWNGYKSVTIKGKIIKVEELNPYFR